MANQSTYEMAVSRGETELKIYDAFDYWCKRENLTEIYCPTNESKFEWFIELLEEKNIFYKAYRDNYNSDFEIRFR